MGDNRNDNPEAIEREIERTQDQMGDTVDKLEERSNPRSFAQSLFGEGNRGTARDAWDVVRESPLPVALIAAGTAWLFATSEAPIIRRAREELKSRFKEAVGGSSGLRSRDDEPAPIGPPPPTGERFDRRESASPL